METTLTAIEYLQQLPEPIKTKAIKAAESQQLETRFAECTGLPGALSVAFLWDKTKEGHAYWLNVSYKSFIDPSLLELI